MGFFLEMLLTAVVSLFFSFLVSKLVSVAMAGNSGGRGSDPTSDEAEISAGDDFVTEELRFGLKMNAQVLESERNFRVVDENVDADRVDELEEAATGSGEIRDKREDLVVATVEAESTAAERQELMVRGQEERSESTEASGEPEEVRVEEESENKMELNTEEEKEELSIDGDDDWEGIERSELEKAFAAAANFFEESGKAEEIGAEAKMELYGLHKIATEGSCREAQPMAVMVSARAKWYLTFPSF